MRHSSVCPHHTQFPGHGLTYLLDILNCLKGRFIPPRTGSVWMAAFPLQFGEMIPVRHVCCDETVYVPAVRHQEHLHGRETTLPITEVNLRLSVNVRETLRKSVNEVTTMMNCISDTSPSTITFIKEPMTIGLCVATSPPTDSVKSKTGVTLYG
jgi:hypothetical protein